MPLHANLEGQNTEEIEDKLVELLKEDLRKSKPIQINGCSIVDVRQVNSIVLFTCCDNSEEFDQLFSKVAGGHVINIVEQIFNRLLKDPQAKVLSVTIDNEDKDNIQSSFGRKTQT